MSMKKKNVKNLAIALGLVGAMSVAGISAYFTASDTATNNFAVQEVDTDLIEPNFDDNTPVTPNETITKDPQVKNIGTEEQFVFLSVKVPFENIITANLDGTRNAAADTELFTWNSGNSKGAINAAKGAKTGAIDSAWTLVRTNVGTDEVEYIYAYGSATAMTPLAVNATTSALFDSVTMCNAVEGQGLENTTVSIQIDAYAIQKSDLKVSGNGATAPSEVLDVYLAQNTGADGHAVDAATNDYHSDNATERGTVKGN